MGPSTLSFEEEEEEKDVPQVSGAPHPSGSGFAFTKDQNNLLHGRIDSLTSSGDELGGLLHQLQTEQVAI